VPARMRTKAGLVGPKADTPGIEIVLTECWPTKLKIGDLDAKANEAWICEMEMVFKTLTVNM